MKALKVFLLLQLFILQFNLSSHSQNNKPNIIYMMADDMGYADLSCYGQKDYKTPNLDKLAKEGVKFINAYATAPVCTPTRVAYMTGRYPARTQVGLHEPLEWSTSDSMLGLSPAIPSVATLLKKAGYETFLVGKWHLGFKPQFNPTNNGFDYFYGFHGGALDYISHTDPKGHGDLYENFTPVKKDGYITDIWAEKAIAIINQPHSKPFFLTLMFNAPHWPWQAPGDKAYPDSVRWVSGGSKAVYAAMVKSLDIAVGAIVNALDKKGLARNTLVIFTSDNGGERFSDMGVFQGSKMTLWEGGIRQPAMVRWPGKIPANSSSNQVLNTMDWTATIVATGGGKAAANFPFDGINLMPIITGKQKELDRTFYWRISQRRDNKAMRDGKWKYLVDEKGNEYLFDLLADPVEKKNLKTIEVTIFDTLKKKYKAWEETMLKPLSPLSQNSK